MTLKATIIMNLNIKDRCFVEGEEYSKDYLKIEVSHELFQAGYCIQDDKNNIIFKITGIVFDESNVLIVFPKSYKISNNEELLKRHVKLLLKVFRKYNNSNKLTVEETDLLGGIGNYKHYYSFLWLLKDYKEHGIINFFTYEYSLNNGKRINWSRTIKQTHPIISNGNPIYTNFIKKRVITNNSNLIRQIHLYALNQSQSLFGWLYNIPSNHEIYQATKLPYSVDVCIAYLNRELNSSFTDRNVKLIQTLKEFLIGNSKQRYQGKVKAIATKYFYNIWEHMINSIIGDVEKDYIIPKPYWNISGERKSSKQIPDTIFEVSNTIYIVDAKYYDTEKTIPGWPDLVKQFFYANTMILDSQKKIENLFLFPYFFEIQTLEYFGYSAIDRKENEYGFIKGFLLNIITLMELYTNNEEGNLKEELIKINNDINKKLKCKNKT